MKPHITFHRGCWWMRYFDSTNMPMVCCVQVERLSEAIPWLRKAWLCGKTRAI